MKDEVIALMSLKLDESPVLRAESLPSENEISDAETELGIPFGTDYRQFLLQFGGAMIGPYPIFGLRPVEVMGDNYWSVVDVTKRYRKDEIPGTNEWIVFSEDHSGNPVGFDQMGVIWTHDHDFDGIRRVCDSFEEYVRTKCLRS